MTSTLTVGAMSKSSSERAGSCRRPPAGSVRNSATCSGANRVGIQPSAISPASAVFFGPDRRQVDRDALLHRRDRQLQRLPGAVRQRQLERLAVELDALARERHPHHRDVLARALELLPKRCAVPALRDLRARRRRSRSACGRPRGCRSWRRSSPSSRRCGRGSGRSPSRARSFSAGGEPGEHRRGVGAVRLRGPHRVVAEPLGLLDDRQLLVGGEAEAPVADVDRQVFTVRLPAARR